MNMSVTVTFRFQGYCELWASIWFADFFFNQFKERHSKLKPCYSVRSYRTENQKRCCTFSRWPWLMCELVFRLFGIMTRTGQIAFRRERNCYSTILLKTPFNLYSNHNESLS